MSKLDDTKLKTGRPSNGENREILGSVTFKVDEETRRALDQLVKLATGGSKVKGMTSAVLRKLILDAAAKKR